MRARSSDSGVRSAQPLQAGGTLAGRGRNGDGVAGGMVGPWGGSGAYRHQRQQEQYAYEQC